MRTRPLILGILAVVLVGCAEEAPPYKPGEGVTPPPPPAGQKTMENMPMPGK